MTDRRSKLHDALLVLHLRTAHHPRFNGASNREVLESYEMGRATVSMTVMRHIAGTVDTIERIIKETPTDDQ